MKIEEVAVVGAGFMGAGIAQTTATYGYPTVLWGLTARELDLAQDGMSRSLAKLEAKGKLPASAAAILGRIRRTTRLDDARGAHLAIETVVEDLSVKEQVFRQLDELLPAGALLASNTSTIPITRFAAVTRRPADVLGLHFSSPVPLMPVAEVIRTVATSQASFQTGIDFVRSLRKEPIPVHFDVPGFVFNRINLASNVEAIRLVEQGYVSVEDVDKAMRLGFGRPMGPFETSDMVGLDTGYRALLALYEETKDPKFLPPDLLRRKVWLGHLGRKTGRGWYEYAADGKRLGAVRS